MVLEWGRKIVDMRRDEWVLPILFADLSCCFGIYSSPRKAKKPT